MNVPRSIATVVGAGKATLQECQTAYSLGDVYLMIEMISVETHNQRVVDEWAKSKGGH